MPSKNLRPPTNKQFRGCIISIKDKEKEEQNFVFSHQMIQSHQMTKNKVLFFSLSLFLTCDTASFLICFRAMRPKFIPALPYCTLLAFLFLGLSCVNTQKSAQQAFDNPHPNKQGKKLARDIRKSAVFARSHTGFTLYDPQNNRLICDVLGDHYFTPASNTKIPTLYASLKYLPDSLPGIQYYRTAEGNIVIRGTADPTFLHPGFQAWQAPFTFLQENKHQKLQWSSRNQKDHTFGDGWNWDDLTEDYAPARASFPMYGNLKKINVDNKPVYVPIQNVAQLWPHLLRDTLGVAQSIDSVLLTSDIIWMNIRSAPVDTLLRLMFQESDNMLAEHCLWMIGGQKFDTIGCSNVIKFMQGTHLKDAPFPFKWVDGSGLSRYNLFTPRSTVWLLHKMWMEYPHERILSLFPAGGRSGTIKNLYKGVNNLPYVFAKTGTLSGVHCLSGYVRTQKGKWLIFSFMHNNYLGGSTPWKIEMQRILEKIAAF